MASSKDLEKTIQDLINKSNQPKTEQEKIQEKILAALDELGGQTVGDDSLVFEGSKFVLPAGMEGNISQAVSYLSDWDRQQNTSYSFSKSYNYRPYDGAAAFERAMKRVFGTTGIGRAQFSFFGSNPPHFESITVGPKGETLQVPWGTVEFSPLEAEFQLGADYSDEYGYVFELSVTAPRRHRKRIEGFFKVIDEELHERSIYKGHAITADPMQPAFVDTSKIDPGKIIYRQEVLTQLEVNMWAPLLYTQALRDAGVPLKRAVLLEGPNGTGKTLAGLRTAQIAQENGWTFILVRASDNPFEALNTAKMYAPAVVWIEDLDVMANASRNRNHIAAVLDALDNVQGKGTEVMAGFTSNFADKLDKSVIRPGRLDAVIRVAELDSQGYEKLIKALIPKDLLVDIDYDKVTGAYDGFLPAFATEAAQRAVRYSIARNQGRPGAITTQDLIDAAHGMRDHLALMANAKNAEHSRNTVEEVLVAAIVDGVKAKMKSSSDHDGYDITLLSKNSSN